MKTVWGENLDREHVLEEYPRPQMVRESYLNLNGVWEYAIESGADAPEAWQGEILVPFSPESELSGVGKRLAPGQTLWYRREVELPQGFFRGRLLLHFGAVDQEALVYVDGREVGSHKGGYLPFMLDITEALPLTAEQAGEYAPALRFTLTVAVKDGTDTTHHARGKQKIKKGGIWYTPQSGIWQSVWMESVPREHIDHLRITPRFDESAVEITVYAEASMPCTVRVGDIVAQMRTNESGCISLLGFTPWSPEKPHLYDMRIQMGEDTVKSYFAMRKFEIKADEEGIKRLFLNNEPCFHNGVLDQGYWPDGLYTPPSDEAMIYDIQAMKALGFNMLRKHVKVEPLRYYYHCDRLGMLVWQDAVNGGGKYKAGTIIAPLFTGKHRKDDDYARFAREDVEGREAYLRELEEMAALLYNSPCVALWVLFNEGWGQFDAAKAMELMRSLDDTRPIDHASGWHDQGIGELKSLHVYFKPYQFETDEKGRAVALSEFGGYRCKIAGHSIRARAFGYKTCKNKEELLVAFTELYEKQIIPAKQKGLAAAVYTQLSDVEGECNGILSYDRKVLKLPEDMLKLINGKLC